MQIKRTFYPELVKVFYRCACVDMEGNLYSIVNGVDMVIDAEFWNVVVGIDMGGIRKFEESMDGYSKMQTYRGMLVYIITNILAPRSSNHAQVTDDDL